MSSEGQFPTKEVLPRPSEEMLLTDTVERNSLRTVQALNEGVSYPKVLVQFLKVNGFDESRKLIIIIIIIIIIIFINCNWVVTRWQWLFYMYTKHEIGLVLNLSLEGYMRSM